MRATRGSGRRRGRIGTGDTDAAWDIPAEIAEEGFLELSIDIEHTVAAAELPKHHADPFDRILIAEAPTAGLWLVAADAAIQLYGLPWIDAGA